MLAASIAMLITTTAEATSRTKPATKQAKKDWTVAVFLNADNNLDYYGKKDEEEMAKVGSNDFMNVVTLIDRESGPAQIDYIEKGNIKKIKDMGEIDMGDYKEFVKFAKFVKENYPAKHYSFTFWNHGSGWKNKPEKAVVRGVSYDETSGNHITTNQLTTALKETAQILGQKIDVLNFDACLMQMAEVCYACKDYANIMVASEETEPGKGAPYDEILKDVKKGMRPEDFADNWVGSFLISYSEDGSQDYQAATQSAVDLRKFNVLTDAIDGFAKAVIAGKHSDIVRRAGAWAQHYAEYDNIDLISLLDSMKDYLRDSTDAGLKTAMDKLRAAMKDVIIAQGYTVDSLDKSNGIAIYLPQNGGSVPGKYRELAFAKETMWCAMLDELAKRAIIDEVIKDVKEGKTQSLKKAVTAAKKQPKNAVYRSLLSEVNFAYASENSVPADKKQEVKKLLEELQQTIKR